MKPLGGIRGIPGVVLVLCLGCMSMTVNAQQQIFLYVATIKGESTDRDHKDWIEVESIATGLNPAAAQGAPTPLPLTVTKTIDKATPKLYEAACKGTSLTSMSLEVQYTGGETPIPFLIITLENVRVLSLHAAAAAPAPLPVEEVSFTYQKITWTYRWIGPDGRIKEIVTTTQDFGPARTRAAAAVLGLP